MKKTRILVVIAFIAIGFTAYKIVVANRRAARDERIAAEAEAAVESFLRAGGAKRDPVALVDQYHREIGESLPKEIGEFDHLEGSGFSYPVWAVALYPYLDLRRTAHFTHASIPMRILVIKGSKSSQVGAPTVRDHDIYVSHPDLTE